jgi:hypothetical protein
MNRTLYAVALLAALSTAGVAHAQMNPAPPSAIPSPPPAKPSAAEPIKQIPDPTLPNNTGTGCGMGMPEGRGSAQATSPSSNGSAQAVTSPSTAPIPNPAAPCR